MEQLLVHLRRLVKKALIAIAVIRPAARGRHGLVGPVELVEMKRRFQISFLRGRGLLPNHSLLDLGCGTLRGGIPIIDYLDSGNYCGLGVRSEVLDEARNELAEYGLGYKEPLLLEMSEAGRRLSGRRFSYIWAFSVLIHMSDSVLEGTLEFVADHLANDGVCYGNVNIGRRAEGDWQGFPCVTRPLNLYERVASACGLNVKVLGSLESLGHISGFGTQDQQVMLEFTRGERKGG